MCLSRPTTAQEFVYDQQSATEQTVGAPGEGGFSLTTQAPIGKSFVPIISSVGFVRLYVTYGNSLHQVGSMLVTLRADSITGPVVSSTDPVKLADGFRGYTTFYFPHGLTVSPGATYVFQPSFGPSSGASGGSVAADRGFNYKYPAGMVFARGSVGFDPVAWPIDDLWFREGIVVRPRISNITKPDTFSATVTVDNAITGSLYSLQVSADLKTWTTITTETATSSSLRITDSSTADTSATTRFYRVIAGP